MTSKFGKRDEGDNRLNFLCNISLTDDGKRVRRTSIGCTIGPASNDVEMLVQLMEAGMSLARINVSHGTKEQNLEIVDNIRKAADNYSAKIGNYYPIAIGFDLRGPEIRLGHIDGSMAVKVGDTIRLTTNLDYGQYGRKDLIYVDYDKFMDYIALKQKIYIDNGAVCLVTVELSGDVLTCVVEKDGVLQSHKLVNVPDVEFDMPVISEKDTLYVKLAIEKELDLIFPSYIRSVENIREFRKMLGEKGKNIRIVAKIQEMSALYQFDKIAREADAVLIPRGDLIIQASLEKVNLVQKAICAKSNKLGKPVMVGQGTMATTIYGPSPTRVDVFDVENTVLDGVDCIMLYSNTATGVNPVRAAQLVASYCLQAEKLVWQKKLFKDLTEIYSKSLDTMHALAISAIDISYRVRAAGIIVLTTSGRSAFMVARFRPQCPILAVTRFPQVARICHLYRGILPVIYSEPTSADWLKDIDNRVNYALNVGQQKGFVKSGDPVVIASGWKRGSPETNTIRIIHAYFDKDKDADDATENKIFECVLKPK